MLRSSMLLNSWVVLAATASSFSLFFHPFSPGTYCFCHAWGTTGHEIVANVAWRRLSNETREWVIQVLSANVSDEYVEEDHDNGDNTLAQPVRDYYDDDLRDDDDPGSPLGAVADWADRVRHFLPWSAALHYIDVRDDLFPEGCHIDPHLNPSCRFDYDRDCPNHTCVAGAIVNYTQQLLPPQEHEVDQSQAKDQPKNGKLRGSVFGSTMDPPLLSNELSNIPKTKEALMFLTHFIGDIHQPLHCSRTTDKGGNDFHVHFDVTTTATALGSTISNMNDDALQHPHGWNLHSVWDTGLIDVALARDYNDSRAILEQALWEELEEYTSRSATTTGGGGGGGRRRTSSNNVKNYLDCDKALGANETCTIQWGQESWDLAIRYAYTLDDNRTDVTNGAILDEEYYQTRWPMAKDRLLAGAVRLAGTLEYIVVAQTTTSQTQNHDGSSNLRPGAASATVSTFFDRIIAMVSSLDSGPFFWWAT